MLHVALDEHLAFFPIGGRGQRHDTEDARTDFLRQRLYGAALAGGIPAFEQDDHPQFLRLRPLLEVAKLDLELAQFLLIDLPLHPGRGWIVSCHVGRLGGPTDSDGQSPQLSVMPMSPGTPPGKSMIW